MIPGNFGMLWDLLLELYPELPNFLVKDSVNLTDKCAMLNYLNEHFITAGHLFDSFNSDLKSHALTDEPSVVSRPPVDCSFHFEPSEVHSVLKKLDSKKSAGPDSLVPFFLKLAADLIAEPLTSIFNLSLSTNKLPKVWKSAFVLPLLKGGEPSVVNNYRPISKLPYFQHYKAHLILKRTLNYGVHFCT